MSSPNTYSGLRYVAVTVPVTTTAASLWSLIKAARPNDYVNMWSSVLSVQYTAAKSNTGNILTGDSSVAVGTDASTRQCGAELASGEGAYEGLVAERTDLHIDLQSIYAVADTGTQYLNLRIRA
jgi:hypothetical protein